MPDSATLSPSIDVEAPGEAPAVAALIERVFGPGRYAKAAERLREGNQFIRELSFVARRDGAVVGAVRLWPVRIGERPALLLGPIAVESSARHHGLGRALALRSCEAAARHGHAVVVLVGDRSFFCPLGFEPVEPGAITFPGPADPQRILVKPLNPGALDGLAGPVTLP
ncbi:MAG: N-acetyltransferase [Caulobacteraceae bacterium]